MDAVWGIYCKSHREQFSQKQRNYVQPLTHAICMLDKWEVLDVTCFVMKSPTIRHILFPSVRCGTLTKNVSSKMMKKKIILLVFKKLKVKVLVKTS